MTYGTCIKEIGRGAKGARSLSETDAEALFYDMLTGQVPDLELGAVLLSLRIKGESHEELLGFCQAMQRTTQHICATNSKPLVVLPTYNGVRRQPNLLPLLTQLLSEAGFNVLIHGRHDFDNRENPFPLFAACGIYPAASIEQANTALDKAGMALVDIGLLNPELNRLLDLRTRLGVRNTAHTLCKLLDPCPGDSIRIVNVTHPEYLVRMSALLSAQGSKAMLLRGTEGEPFANPRRRPELMGFNNGVATCLFSAEEGGTPPLPGWPESADLNDNLALLQCLLADRERIPQPLLDQVQGIRMLAS